MNKKIALLIAAFMITVGVSQLGNSAYGFDTSVMYKGKNELKQQQQKQAAQNSGNSQQANSQNSTVMAPEDYPVVEDKDIFGDDLSQPAYYAKATLNSAISKYKNKNYTGCIQELYSILKKDKNNSTAYYYLAMAYTKAGKTDQAKAAYKRIINLNKNDVLVQYAINGLNTLEGNASSSTAEAMDDMDKFIYSPYGNGFSKEVNDDWRKRQLEYIQKKINKGQQPTPEEIQRLEELNKSEGIVVGKIAMGLGEVKKNSETPSNREILDAVDVLKRAGLNISAQPVENTTDVNQVSNQAYQQQVQQMQQYQPDPQIQQMTMMLNGGNSNNVDPMMYMMPYMMNGNNGQNMDPRVIQALMMNSMMGSINSMDFSNNNDR